MNKQFNINKCNINVDGHQCKRNRTSGCTTVVNDELICMCRQHWTKYVIAKDVPVFQFTGEKFVNQIDLAFEKITNNQSKEDTMNSKHEYDDSDYDAEMDINVAIAAMEGNEYTTYSTPYSGNFLIEVCRHDECDEAFNEMMHEARHEVCCGNTNCKHYTAVLCLHHTKKENIMNTTKGITCGHCHNKHNTAAEVAACYGVERKTVSTNMSKVQQSSTGSNKQWFSTRDAAIAHAKTVEGKLFKANNGHGFWVYWKQS